MSDWEEFLNTHYFDPEHPGAFAGPYKLYQILKEIGKPTSYGNVKKWLQKQDAFTLLQPVKYRIKRQRIITQGIDDLWDADLADVTNLAQHNSDIHFLLIVIDVFSKYLWVEPLPDKTHGTIIKAFRHILKERQPKLLRTDKGTEFTNRWVKQLFKKQGIHAYTTKNETKANYAERVIRTLKGLMYRYFIHKQTYKYIDILSQLVTNYNHRPHSSLKGLSPAKINKTNEAKVWKRMYVDTLKLSRNKKYKFKVKDQVRISHLKYVFQRDYQQKWTDEIFIVIHRCRKQGINLYQVKDFLDESIDGHFYEEELQKVTKDSDSLFKVEKVLKTRKRQDQTEYFVKWLGWSKKFNSWIKEADIQLL